MKIYKLPVAPVAKPRMTRSDTWKKRPATTRYWAFKDAINLEMNRQDFVMPDKPFIIFNLPMPPGWSKKKKLTMSGTYHRQKPDIDNLIKSWDSWIKDDSYIACVFAVKLWAVEGSIIICDMNYILTDVDDLLDKSFNKK